MIVIVIKNVLLMLLYIRHESFFFRCYYISYRSWPTWIVAVTCIIAVQHRVLLCRRNSSPAGRVVDCLTDRRVTISRSHWMWQNRRLCRTSMLPLPRRCRQFRQWRHSDVCYRHRSQTWDSLQAVAQSAVPTHWHHPQHLSVSSRHRWRFPYLLQSL